MTKTVTIAATRTNGDPYAHHDVIVTLVAGSAGGVVGSNVIVSQTKVPLDASGQGSIVLATNDVEITSPSTSFYRFTVEGSSPTITRSVRITDALPSTISWTRSGIEVGDPTIPQRDVSSDYVQVGDQSLTNYLADLEAGGGGGSSDAITVPDGTMAFIGAYYPPASDDLTDHLGSIDDAFVGAAQAIVAVGAASIDNDQKGAPNGVAELDGSGLVLSSQLPSYVDDVIVVADYAALPGTGADGKIYVTSDTNLTYRWTGSAYTEISKSLALGTTSSTAHRGDLGSTAYTHSQATGNPHGTTADDLGVLRPGGPAFHAAASSAAMTALSAVRGDVCFRGDLGHTLYVLTSNTPTNLGDWTVLRFNSSTPLFPSSFTAKGDLLVATGAGTFAAVPRGADGTVLKAKTSETPGVEWGDAVDTATLARIPTTVTVASDVPSPTDGTFTNTTGLAVPVVNAVVSSPIAMQKYSLIVVAAARFPRPSVVRCAEASASSTKARPAAVKSASAHVPAPVAYGTLFAADVSAAICVRSVSSGWKIVSPATSTHAVPLWRRMSPDAAAVIVTSERVASVAPPTYDSDVHAVVPSPIFSLCVSVSTPTSRSASVGFAVVHSAAVPPRNKIRVVTEHLHLELRNRHQKEPRRL